MLSRVHTYPANGNVNGSLERNQVQLPPAIPDPRVTEIRLQQMKIEAAPLKGFFFISYIGNSGNPPILPITKKVVGPWRSVIAGFNCINYN